MKFILKHLLSFLNILLMSGLVIAYISPYVNPLDFWPIGFFGLTYKAWLIVNLVAIVIWLLLKKKFWRYNALIILIGFPFIFRNLQFHSSSDEKSDFTVMAFNTRVQQVYDNGNTSEQINKYVVEHGFDVVFLVEWLDKMGSIDVKAYPHQQSVIIHSGGNKYEYGLKVVSKHKIIDFQKIEYGHFSNNITAIFDIEINEQIVRFVGTHLQTNSLGPSDYTAFLKFDFDEESKQHAKTVLGKMRRSMERRSIQTEKILEAIEESPYPVVIIGDFNDTPQSYAYQQLRNGRYDAFIARGNGWGATYLKPFPLLRIDFILYDKQLHCVDFNSSDEIESDHKLLTAGFKF